MESEHNQDNIWRMSQQDNLNAPEQNSTRENKQNLRFEDVVTPEHLQIISQASGGFSFRPDHNLPPGRVGYTNMRTKEIRYNPQIIEKWEPHQIRGFTYHEAGHHAPEVLALDNSLTATLRNPELIPQSYQGDPDTEARFIRALSSNLHNALLDIWLERFMSRRPYYGVRDDIEQMNLAMGEHQSYRQMPKPEQFIQALLSIRYRPNQNMKDKLDPDVFEAFKRAFDTRAMSVIEDRSVHENYFSSSVDKQRDLRRKMLAYEQVFLPEYIKLMEAELQKRKNQKQQQQNQQNNGGGKSSSGEGQDPVSESVPMTKEEMQELIDQLLKEMEQYGKELESSAPSQEQEQQKSSLFDQISKMLKDRKDALDKGQKYQPEPKEHQPKTGDEAIMDAAKKFQKQDKDRDNTALADQMDVDKASVETWERIKVQYRIEIESLASNLADIFLDDRRKRIEFMLREGEIVPGLEYESVVAVLSGQLDPETKMRPVANPEFLETELEFVVDTSGSMAGSKIEESVKMMVITVEAFKKVMDDLRNEDLLGEGEHPFRIGATKFAGSAERITKLDEPLDNQKELRIVDKVSKVGGSTEETGALMEAYEALKLGQDNVIKMIFVLTDGAGNVDGVRPIIQQIEKDGEVIFLAIALGDPDESDQVLRTYLDPLKNRMANVFGMSASNPKDIMPKFLDFMRREVEKRRRKY